MDLYKEASRRKLRFSTEKGMLSVEQLWELNLVEIDKIAVKLTNENKHKVTKSFITTDRPEEKNIELEIVMDVLTTKLGEGQQKTKINYLKAEEQTLLNLLEENKVKELRENPSKIEARLKEIQNERKESGVIDHAIRKYGEYYKEPQLKQ